MIARLKEWWRCLGYMRPRDPEFKVWGIRPWRGAPFFMFIIDSKHKYAQSWDKTSEIDE